MASATAAKEVVKGYRALHYVLKIGNRKEAIDFLRGGLGMKVLRHEEFEKGCAATCNGPYDGKWSKTMIGYGDEDNHFVLELTYNYGISSYRHGNSLFAIEIGKKDISHLVDLGAKLEKQRRLSGSDATTDVFVVYNNGYRFEISHNPKGDEISGVTIASGEVSGISSANLSDRFYVDLLGMNKIHLDHLVKQYTYGSNQALLGVKPIMDGNGSKVEQGTAFGRFAFACPTSELSLIEKKIAASTETLNSKVLTPFTALDTPGKATVNVVIVADPYGHEICFVGDEGFRQLSKIDPQSDSILNKKIAEDKSDEWFEKHGKTKEHSA